LARTKINGLGVGVLSIIILTAVIGISFPPAHAEVTKVALVTDALFSDQGWGTNAYMLQPISVRNMVLNLELQKV